MQMMHVQGHLSGLNATGPPVVNKVIRVSGV